LPSKRILERYGGSGAQYEIEEDVDVQLLGMYNYRWFFATAVGYKMKDSQVQRELPELLNMWPIHSMVQQYPRKKFRSSVPGGWSDFVHRHSAWAVSEMRMTDAVNAYGIGKA
jgi:hypothetical protein